MNQPDQASKPRRRRAATPPPYPRWERLRELRQSRGLSLRVLGIATGVDFALLSRLERGRAQGFGRGNGTDMANVYKLARFFKVPWDEIVPEPTRKTTPTGRAPAGDS